MKHCKTAPTVAAAVAFAIAAAGGAGTAAADEVSELKAAVAALQQRLDQLESKTKEAVETNDRQTDLIAKTRTGLGDWVGRTTWSGDLRYRNEDIRQEFAKDRNRDRIRARFGFVSRVNDTIRATVQLSTADANDPRSPNTTLTGENPRRNVALDLAYAEWQPYTDWKFSAGKMRYPWVRAGQSTFFDGDVNPEGLAVNWTHGNLFASAFYDVLEERTAAGESLLVGGQGGWRWNISSVSRLTVGASYFDFTGVQGKNPFYNAIANGNTTTTSTAVCSTGIATCLLSDYTQVEGFAEFTTMVGKLPLTVYGDYFKNVDAATAFDTAYSAGVMLGRASNPHTWEVGYAYQHQEKDALFGQFIDSDYGGGNTDAEGSILKFNYVFARNYALNLTYFLNETNIDVPVTVAGVGAVTNRNYKRWQIDLNARF
jgi:hypothetical protein